MEIVTNIVAAEDDEVGAIGESACPLDSWSGIDASGIDTLKLATLHCLLTDDSLQAALDLYEPVFVADNEAETIVLRVADELFEQLVALDDESIDALAGELAASEAFESEGWVADDVQTLLGELSQLAQLAESQGQSLFVWIYRVE